MMLTHGEKLDVLHKHDLARLGIEDRVVTQSVEALRVPRRQKIEGACRAVWRSPQSLTLGILADGFEQATERFFHSGQLRRGARPQICDAPLGCLQFALAITSCACLKI